MGRKPALSASRAKDYLSCPLKFRYLVVDGIRQPPTEATVKGTVVHTVLEDLFTLPHPERTLDAALSILPGAWDQKLTEDSRAAELFSDPEAAQAALGDMSELLEHYFRLERPQNLSPRSREQLVDSRLSSGILLRGIVDRIDEAPDGALRVVDYKTGRSPSPAFIDDALFQMRFYALLLRDAWTLPKRLQLLYLRGEDVLTLDPAPRDIDAFEMRIVELWSRIESDARAERFEPTPSKLCGWCPFQDRCPKFGGAPTPISSEGLEKLLEVRQPTPNDEAA